MNLSPFHEIKSHIEKLRTSNDYADDTVVDGLYNRAELLIKKIPDKQFKDNLFRMFNEIKVRNRAFNNNQKLLALENLFSNIINTVDAERLLQNPTQHFNINDALQKVKRTKEKHQSELAEYQQQYVEAAYRAAQQPEKQTGSVNRFFGNPIVNLILGILGALLVAYIVFKMGWN